MRVTIVIFACLTGLAPVGSAAGKAPQWETLSFTDADGDEKNDVFKDADGDGVNDVSGKPYRHSFGFVDGDGDGKNDLFSDENGDGVNDIAAPGMVMGRGYCRVIDSDGDGVNDVTGVEYEMRGFVDEDGDGINDNAGMGGRRGMMGRGKSDTFVDKNGDGINDGRGLSRERRLGKTDEMGRYRGGRK